MTEMTSTPAGPSSVRICTWPLSRRRDAQKGDPDEFKTCPNLVREAVKGSGRPPAYCVDHDDALAANRRRTQLRKAAGQVPTSAEERPVTTAADRQAQIRELTLPDLLGRLEKAITEMRDQLRVA